ncbi:MAG: IS21 family transposase [Chitinophagaceae bacterium]
MAQKSIEMNLVKRVQQLRGDGVSIKEIVRRVGLTRKTVKKYLHKLEGVPCQPEAEGAITLADKDLAAIIYNNDLAPVAGKRIGDLTTHFEYAQKELNKTGVTKQLLWLEYIDKYSDGFKYSQYCNLFMKHLKNANPAFHWQYIPGEFIQVDFAGKKLPYVNKEISKIIYSEVFVAVLPYSGLIFCIAVHSQKTEDFACCINEMVKYIGGLTKTILCDNLKTAVTKSDKYEPVFTEVCHQLSDHYNTTFSATRSGKPTDKAMVEKSVNIIYNNIYSLLRNTVSGSLEELNRHIRKYLDLLNLKPYKGSSESRRDIFIREEQQILKPLPETPYLLKKCKKVKVNPFYYVQIPDNGHYYSVPYQHVGQTVSVYYNRRTVEVYYNYERISFHVRSSTEANYSRIDDHMPDHHKHIVEQNGWTIEDLTTRAGWVGPYTRQAADRIIHSSIYPEQNFKACNAMIMLFKKYSKPRLEAACQRAAHLKRPTLKLIRTILAKGLDKQPLLFDQDDDVKIPAHENIRGSGNYK